MGCVQTKSSTYSPTTQLEELKQENGYAKGRYGGRPIRQRDHDKLTKQEVDGKRVVVLSGANGGGGQKVFTREGEKNGGGNGSQRIVLKKMGGDEFVDGWPKWLVENIPRKALDGLVPKSADSYDKLAKVSA